MEKVYLLKGEEQQELNFQQFLEQVESNRFYYFDRKSSYKTLKDIIDQLEEEGHSVYFRQVKYGLDEDAFLYEMHVI
ncbi:MAG: HP0268 family nuclease [Campylobacterales bacterium]